MKKTFLIIFLPLLISCFQKVDKRNCAYTIKQFYKEQDSSKYIINNYSNYIEVFDNANSEERGFYKFDHNGVLRFYAFLLDSTNGYNFGIEYDSLGHEIKSPNSQIVRWYFAKHKQDSLNVSFLLYTVNKIYGKIQMHCKDFNTKVPLFESNGLSNLIGGNFIIRNPQKKEIIYIEGMVKNKCTNELKNFKDSIFIPLELLKNG